MFRIPRPQLQISFAYALKEARQVLLQEALGKTVSKLDLSVLDTELAALASVATLSALAGRGLRGELVFVTPCALMASPYLLGYYRLLLGFSQKEFYTAKTGASYYKSAETSGQLSPKAISHLSAFCAALNLALAELIAGVGIERVSKQLLDDLSLLTLGPQLRGGANVRKGDAAIAQVFEIIHRIVQGNTIESGNGRIRLDNAAGRPVLIEFAPDPDLILREEISEGVYRNIIAIEIKGGTDYSNIHNRIGEAEKSHQKARQNGFTECWTIVNVDGLDSKMAHKESPTTNRFYRLSDLLNTDTSEFKDFRNRIVSLSGIKSQK